MSNSTLTTSITLKSKDTPFRKYLEGCCENKIPIESSVYDCFCIWLSRFQGTNLVPSNEIDIDWKSVKDRQFKSFAEIERALAFSKKFVGGIVIKKVVDNVHYPKTILSLEQEASAFERWVEEYRIDLELSLEESFITNLYPLLKVTTTPATFYTLLPTNTPPPIALSKEEEEDSFDLVSVSRVRGAKELNKSQLEALQKHIDKHASKEETYLLEGTAIRFIRTLPNYCQPNDIGYIVNKTNHLSNEYWVRNSKSVRKFSAVLNEDFELLNSTESNSESILTSTDF